MFYLSEEVGKMSDREFVMWCIAQRTAFYDVCMHELAGRGLCEESNRDDFEPMEQEAYTRLYNEFSRGYVISHNLAGTVVSALFGTDEARTQLGVKYDQPSPDPVAYDYLSSILLPLIAKYAAADAVYRNATERRDDFLNSIKRFDGMKVDCTQLDDACHDALVDQVDAGDAVLEQLLHGVRLNGAGALPFKSVRQGSDEGEAVTDPAPEGGAPLPFQRGYPSPESRPWARIENPEDIRAFVAETKAEELREMAALFQADSGLTSAWAAVRERIVLAVYAYEGAVRKLTSAEANPLGHSRRRTPAVSD